MTNKINYINHLLNKQYELLKAIKKNLKPYSNIDTVKIKTLNCLENLLNVSHETLIGLDDSYVSFFNIFYDFYTINIKSNMEIIKESEDIDQISLAIGNVIYLTYDNTSALEILNTYTGHRYYSSCRYRRFTRQRSDLIEASNTMKTSSNIISNIFSSIDINRKFSVFEPFCDDGKNLRYIEKLYNDNCETYALEYENKRYSVAKENTSKCIKGRFNNITISNNCFDVILYDTPISILIKETYSNTVQEKFELSSIKKIIKYLKNDGIFVLGIPLYRLTKDLNMFLSKNFKDITILQDDDKDYIREEFVTIIAVKKEDVKNYDTLSYKTLSNKNISNKININYALPNSHFKKPDLFKSNILDEQELINMIDNSNLVNNFWKKQNTKNFEEDASMKPLLPFNVGQIGLILTSGCLDGVIEETKGQYHAIKGNVIKIRSTSNEEEDSQQIVTDVYSNKVQINILTPDGEYIELT